MATIVGKKVERVTKSQESGKIPAREGQRPRFFLMHHPGSWSFDDESGEWLPTLSMHRMDPGAMGIDERMDPSLAIAERERAGWHVIKPEDARLGEFQDYVRSLPHAAGRPYHVAMWHEVEVVAGRVFITRDEAMYREFRRHIVLSGIVPALDPRFKSILLKNKEATVNRLAKRSGNAMPGSPAHEKYADAKARQERMTNADGPTDKPKRRGRKAAPAPPEVTL